jgi:Transcription activator MBF2
MKYKILLLLSVCGVFEVFSISISIGEIKPTDLLVFDQLFHQKAVPYRSHCESFEFNTKHGQLITAIHVTDLTHKQDGGRIRIICGGVGHTYVKYQTISECSRQVLLTIEIFVNPHVPEKSETSSEPAEDLSKVDFSGPIH